MGHAFLVRYIGIRVVLRIRDPLFGATTRRIAAWVGFIFCGVYMIHDDDMGFTASDVVVSV